MKRAILMAALILTSSAVAQEQPRHDGHAPLAGLVGSWTIAGREGSYLETCAWYHGEHHIICNTESTRKDGSKSKGMSILSQVPGKGYVYTGIGSGGRYETYAGGTFEDGILEYNDKTSEGHTRIRIGPFNDRKVVPFNVSTSRDGAKWEPADSFSYIRIK